jgi:hypothetical protein
MRTRMRTRMRMRRRRKRAARRWRCWLPRGERTRETGVHGRVCVCVWC